MSKSAVFILLFLIVITIFSEPIITKGLLLSGQDLNQNQDPDEVYPSFIIQGDSLLANSYLPRIKATAVKKTENVTRALITAYSSSPDEVGPLLYITASGTYVRHGVAASNFLPISTRIRFPGLFGNQVFIIEDRMDKRYNNRVDIWMSSKAEAKNFGIQTSDIEIL